MIFGKRYFEKVFARSSPWGYDTSEYENAKYQRQLEAIKRYSPAPKSILEIGCAEGIHTRMLAEAFPEAKVLALDICGLAIERAKECCCSFPNIELVEGDIIELFRKDRLGCNRFDIIIQSESLYYLFPGLLLKMGLGNYFRGMAYALKEKGILVTANGLNVVTNFVMGTYYLALKRYCRSLHSAKYREWNEFRRKYVTYELRVFGKRSD